MTDKIYIHIESSSKVVQLPALPPLSCKEAVDTLRGGILLEGNDLVVDSRILEAGKHYTLVKAITAGSTTALATTADIKRLAECLDAHATALEALQEAIRQRKAGRWS
ncbi:hypothetical protein WJX72_012246 [[Myrmecia] bisecta]|uniref:Uncharacterized protein n=1 Tax=[Myrmecia] bisecta TaxID=41462 RepID=A0AAW1QC32_9CHLO